MGSCAAVERSLELSFALSLSDVSRVCQFSSMDSREEDRASRAASVPYPVFSSVYIQAHHMRQSGCCVECSWYTYPQSPYQ
eukprot:3103620-Amphidinium_carterae.1